MAERFGEVDLYLEFSTTELCDTRCKQANPATVHDCVCSCLGENHGGKGKPRDWKLSGATTLVSHGPTRERYLLVRRGDPPLLPKPEKIGDSAQPEPASIPEPASEATPIPAPAPVPVADPVPPAGQQTNPERLTHQVDRTPPASQIPRSAGDEPLPLGCGIAMFVTTVTVCTIFALAVNELFWIGVVLAVLVVLAVGAERGGLL
ncbi:hypothetical protein [Nocardia cyriacigeorgica]|nr:hypothetical protein [Nocardia cyriacigeorgica]